MRIYTPSIAAALALLTITFLPAFPQLVPTQQVPSGQQSSSAVPLLDVYDFSLAGGGKGSERTQALQQAIPDSLFLQILGEPRIKARRIREPYASHEPYTSAAALIKQRPSEPSGIESRHSEVPLRYVLDGKLIVMEASTAAAEHSDHPSFPNSIIFIRYSLRKVGQDSDSNLLIDQDKRTPFAQLSTTLGRISDQVVATLLPPSKTSVLIKPPQLESLPPDRRAFYAENLPDLLESELRGLGWINLVHNGDRSDFSIAETVRLEKGTKGYELEVTVLVGDIPIPPLLKEKARETEVLAVQLRLAGQVIDVLKSSRALSASGLDPLAEPSVEDYLKAAESYAKTDPDASITLYKRALELDSSNTKTRLALALVYLGKNEADQTLKVLNDPDVEQSSAGQYLRSLAFALRNDSDKAIEAANRAVDLAPEVALGYFWRSHLFTAKGDFTKALADLEVALKLKPEDTDYYEEAAQTNLRLGRYDQAIVVLEDGRTKTADAKRLTAALNETRRRAADHFLTSNNPTEGLRFALASTKEEPGSELGQRLVGIAYHLLGNLPEAEQSLRTALNIKETEQVYEQLALIELEQGKKGEAISFAEKAIEINGDATEPYAVLEAAVSGPLEAKQVMQWLKAYWTKNPPARSALLSWAYLQAEYLPGDPAEIDALYSAFLAATKSAPYSDWKDGWIDFVELEMMKGEYTKAAADANELLKIDPRMNSQIGLRLYLWIVQVLQGNCTESQVALKAFTDFLGRPELNGSNVTWTLKNIRRLLNDKVGQGLLNGTMRAIVDPAVELLESRPMKEPEIHLFLDKVRSLTSPVCENPRTQSYSPGAINATRSGAAFRRGRSAAPRSSIL